VIVILLREIMSRQLVTVTPDTPLSEARHLLAEHRIRRLPAGIANRRLIEVAASIRIGEDQDVVECVVGDLVVTDGSPERLLRPNACGGKRPDR